MKKYIYLTLLFIISMFILLTIEPNFSQSDEFVNACSRECRTRPARYRWGKVDGRKFNRCKPTEVRTIIRYAGEMNSARSDLFQICPISAQRYFR